MIILNNLIEFIETLEPRIEKIILLPNEIIYKNKKIIFCKYCGGKLTPSIERIFHSEKTGQPKFYLIKIKCENRSCDRKNTRNFNFIVSRKELEKMIKEYEDEKNDPAF